MPASDSHKLPQARTYTPLDAFRYHDNGRVYVYLNEPGHRLPEEFVPAAEVERLREALSTAADDLDKAANQFEGIRQSQLAGHTVPISGNPSKFAEKAQRAREALEAGER
jgi:hypothetical protein